MLKLGLGQRGAVYPMVIVALMALMGMAALSVDVGTTVLAKQQLQAAADAAALAGVGILQTDLDPELAAFTAVDTAAGNGVAGRPLTLDPDVDIVVGAWNDAARQIEPFDSSGGMLSVPDGVVAVEVTARRTADAPDGPIPLHFARVLGIDSASISASATAGLTIAKRDRPPVEAVIVQDQSGSFEQAFPYARAANLQFIDFMRECHSEGDLTAIVGFGYHPNAEVPPSSTAKRRDTWLFHNRPLHSNEDSPEGADATAAYIEGMATVPFYEYPDYHCYTSLYTGLLMAVLHFAEPTARQTAWANFENSLFSSGTFRNIGWWRQNYYSSLKTKMAPLFQQGFANPNAEHVIVLVSDGMPWYHGNSFPDTRSQDLCTYIADQAAAMGIRIHTVTLDLSSAPADGSKGADSTYNASLVRNGGYAFYTYEPERLRNLLVGVGQIEVGQAHLVN